MGSCEKLLRNFEHECLWKPAVTLIIIVGDTERVVDIQKQTMAERRRQTWFVTDRNRQTLPDTISHRQTRGLLVSAGLVNILRGKRGKTAL